MRSPVHPKKSLGQHFLQDPNILRKIAALVDPRPDDRVIEIGPGTGALTRLLAGRCKLTCVEIDGRAIPGLRGEFGPVIDLIHDDIRNIDLGAVRSGSSARIVGNIPYNITSDILFWVFEHRREIADVTLLMQEEVADRLVASPRTKEYGILSVCTQVYAKPAKAFRVSRRCFYPVPDVNSTVVHLTMTAGPPPELDPVFRALVRGLFGKRRKTIRNGLRHMGYPDEALALAGDHLAQRPEELEPREFVRLAENFRSVALP